MQIQKFTFIMMLFATQYHVYHIYSIYHFEIKHILHINFIADMRKSYLYIMDSQSEQVQSWPGNMSHMLQLHNWLLHMVATQAIYYFYFVQQFMLFFTLIRYVPHRDCGGCIFLEKKNLEAIFI